MTIVKHRPLGTFDDLFSGFFGPAHGRPALLSHMIGSDDIARSVPRVNVIERKDGFKLDLLAPGSSKEDLKLNVESGILTISAEKKNEMLNEGERFTRREFGYSAFKRSFQLPENVTLENIKAEFSNGVLSVNIPKTEPAKPAAREISIS